MTVVYFAFFLAMPWYTRKEKTAQPPERVTGRFITIPQLLGSILLLILLVVLPLMLVSGSAEAAEANLDLEHVDTDFDDKGSLQRGFKTYMNYCSSCHELGYARYARTAEDLEIPEEVVVENLIFDGSLIGDLIVNAMANEDSEGWFGAAPPDLTLVGRVRKPDWLYSYLKGFYADDTKNLGTNNKIFANVAMPNVLHELQGDVICESHGDPDYCELQHVEGTGEQTPAEFDATIADLVNFLYYVGEPIRSRRQEIGIWVLVFLGILYVLTTLVGREFSKDYH
jgi:ubiquinol-cytochrome c reductase cytochrome b subunit